MKAHRIILYLCLLTLSTNLLGQASVYGEINTTANTNSIIRAWGNQFIIYAEHNGGQGYCHLYQFSMLPILKSLRRMRQNTDILPRHNPAETTDKQHLYRCKR